MSRILTGKSQFTGSKFKMFKFIVPLTAQMVLALGLQSISVASVKSPHVKPTDGELISVIETGDEVILVEKIYEHSVLRKGSPSGFRAIRFDRKTNKWATIENVIFGIDNASKTTVAFREGSEMHRFEMSSSWINSSNENFQVETSEKPIHRINGKPVEERFLSGWSEGVRSNMAKRVFKLISPLYTDKADQSKIASENTIPRFKRGQVEPESNSKGFITSVKEKLTGKAAQNQVQNPSVDLTNAVGTVRANSAPVTSQYVSSETGSSTKRGQSDAKQSEANQSEQSQPEKSAAAPSPNSSNGGYSSSATAMSDLIERSLIATIKEFVTGPFDEEIIKEAIELEKQTKSIDRSNIKNDIFLDFTLNMLAESLYQKHYAEIIERTGDLSRRSLSLWSEQINKQNPEKYPEPNSFFMQYAKSLHGMIDGMHDEAHQDVTYSRMMNLLKGQIRNWVLVRSPQIRSTLKNQEQALTANLDADGRITTQKRVVEGSSAEVYVEGLGAKFTPVQMIIPDMPLEKLLAESPAAIRMQKVTHFAKDFGAQTILFNIPLYFVTMSHVGMDWAKNPMAIDQFIDSLKDPASHAGFAAFIAANHWSSKYWQQLLRLGTPPKPNSKLSVAGYGLRQELAGYLGMSMGMIASSLLSGFWHDPFVQKCAKSYSADKDSCQKAFNSWVPTGKINELLPAVGGLISTAFASTIATKLVVDPLGFGKVKQKMGLLEQQITVLKQFKENGIINNEMGMRLDSLHILPEAVYNEAKLTEYIRKLTLKKTLLFGPIVNVVGNFVFLAVDPFVSPVIEHSYAKMQKTSFDLTRFLELDTPLGNFEQWARFRLFDQVKMPHEIDIKTLPQTFEALQKSMNHFSDSAFKAMDPKECLPKREIPVLSLKSDFGIQAENLKGVRTDNQNCFQYKIPDQNKIAETLMTKGVDKGKSASLYLTLAGKETWFPLGGTFKFEEKESTMDLLVKKPLSAFYKNLTSTMGVQGPEIDSRLKKALEVAEKTYVVAFDSEGKNLIVQACLDKSTDPIYLASGPRDFNKLFDPVYRTQHAGDSSAFKNKEFEDLKDCLEQTDVPFWLQKYAEVNKDWRTHIVSETVNSSLQWSQTIGEFMTMFGGSEYFYNYITHHIWDHRQFAKAVEAQGPVSAEDRKKLKAEFDAKVVEINKSESSDDEKRDEIAHEKRFMLDILTEHGTPEEKKALIQKDRDYLLRNVLSRSNLLAVGHYYTKVPSTNLRATESEIDLIDPDDGNKLKRVKITVPPRTKEERESYDDMYPSHMGDFRIREISDYLVASMACGPEAESSPHYEWMGAHTFRKLDFESITKIVPGIYSSAKNFLPISPVFQLEKGVKFGFLPPRLTKGDSICDKSNWLEDKNLKDYSRKKVNRETRESHSPFASKLEGVLEFIEDVVSGEKRAAPSQQAQQKEKSEEPDREVWTDKAAPLYWQSFKVGDKTYHGVMDYLIDHMREDILGVEFEFNAKNQQFRDWWRKTINDPLTNKDKGVWKDVRQHYVKLLDDHFYPALANNENDKACSNGQLDCGHTDDVYLQANSVFGSVLIEFQTYGRQLRKILSGFGATADSQAMKTFEEKQTKIIEGLKSAQDHVRDYEVAELKAAIEDLQNSYPQLFSDVFEASHPELKKALESAKAKANGQNKGKGKAKEASEVNIDEETQKKILAVKTVVGRIFELMSNVLTELEEYKGYATTMDFNKTNRKAPSTAKPGKNKFDTRARF